MRHRLWSRALALLLAPTLLGAVGGASDLDALLFHTSGRPAAVGVAHVESPARADCHADRCLLATVLAQRGVASRLRAPARFADTPRRATAPQPSLAPRPVHPGLEQQPRAPPPPLA